MNSNDRKALWAALLASAIIGAALLGGCTAGQEQPDAAPGEEQSGEEEEAETGGETPAPAVSAQAGAYDDWQNNNPQTIVLEGDSISVEGTGASADGSVLTITQAGVYVLSGSLTNGRVIVEAGKDDVVQLVLDGADIACGDGAAIYSAKAGTTVVTLAQGSRNTLADGADYAYPGEEADEPDAALFAKGDLVITGTGELTVTGHYNNGIGTKDHLVVEGGALSVTAANHGVRGRDSITVLDGDITIRAGNDGIQSNNDTGEGKGWITLAGGSFDIRADHDGVQAETALTITGGEFAIVAGGGHQEVPADSGGSYKGLKAGGDLLIAGGVFAIDSADDAVHANGNVTVNGGSFAISTGDDGFHADETLTISGGAVIDIAAAYEGLEGQVVRIEGGDIRLAARDDGVNAAGDDGEETGRFGMDRFAANDNNLIEISGGRLVVSASGDGIDSNGHIVMSGGTVIVNGPTSNGDAALDFDGSFTLTGGTLAAAGSSGMAQAPGSDSTQPALQVYFSQTQAAGTTVHLEGEDGASLLTFTPEKEFSNIVLSSPELVSGGVYRVYTGGAAEGAEDGLAVAGAYSGGTLLLEATLEEGTTRISDSGEAVTGGMGFGMGGPGGGMGGRPQVDRDEVRGGPAGERPEGGPGERGGSPPDGEPPAGRGGGAPPDDGDGPADRGEGPEI